MGSLARIFIFFCGALFFYFILKLLVKQKISLRNSMIWLIGTVFILLISILPNLLDSAAALIGVGYPPALLFLVAILVMLYLLLNQSIQISFLNERLKELTQTIAIKEAGRPKEQSEKPKTNIT